MKSTIVFLLSLYLASIGSVLAQNSWIFGGGPWHSIQSIDIAIGHQASGTAVTYSVRATSNTLTKSYDDGDTWIHLPLPVVELEHLLSVACEPDNPDVVYLGLALGGFLTNGEVYKSVDGGESWTFVLSTANAAPVKIAISPHDRQLVYVGCESGSPFDRIALYFSENGGVTWGNYQNEGFPQNAQVSDIVFDPVDPDYRYVSVAYPSVIAGCWRTDNGGQLWRPVNEGFTSPNVTALAIDPETNSTLYASLISQTGVGSIFKSYDHGENWQPTTFSLAYPGGIAALEVNQQQPNVVLAGTYRHGVFRTTNHGLTWDSSNTNLLDDDVQTMKIDSRNGSKVFVGTITAFYRSDNGGVSWTEKTKGLERTLVTGMAADNGLLVTNSHIPLHRSSDNGQSWITVYGFDGISGGSSYNRVAMLSGNPSKVFASRLYAGPGSQSSEPLIDSVLLYRPFAVPPDEETDPLYLIYRSFNAGVTWEPVLQTILGLNTALVIDPNNASALYAASDLTLPPFSYPLVRSTDDGNTWEPVFTQVQASFFAIDASIVGSNGLSQVMYIGDFATGMWRSTDAGEQWTQLPFPSSLRPISLAVGTFDSNILYTGTLGDGVHKSTDRGDSWFPANIGITQAYVDKIVADPRFQNRLYALLSFQLFGQKYLYMTVNGGSTWSDITNNLLQEATSINDVVIDYIADVPILNAATDKGVYHFEPNFWQGIITQNTTWAGTVYVVGDVEVASGVTLTVVPGTVVKFSPETALSVNGSFQAIGEAGNHITFTWLNQTELSWKGIRLNGARTGDRIEYADITDATVGIFVNHNSQASIAHCTITGAKIGTHLYDFPGPLPLQPTTVRNNEIRQSRIVGISIDEEASNVTIQDNTLKGNFDDDVGLQFIYASPLQVVRNMITDFGKHGIQCISASPSFIDGTEEGGRSCFVNNRIGVYGEASANFILGIAYDDGTSSGNNTIAYNEEFEIVLRDNSTVYSQMNYHGSRDFDIDNSSKLITDPELGEDPNRCLDQGNRPLATNAGNGLKQDDPPMLSGFARSPLVKQAVRFRLRRDHLAAIGVLKGLIAAYGTDVELQRWALHELLANYQMVPSPSGSNILSGYLQGLLHSQPNAEIKRTIRDVLGGSLRHEREIAATLAALDTSIHLYPNTSSELLALYSKISLALNVLNDHTLAQSTFQTLQARYPEHSITHVGDVLVNGGGQLRPTGKSIAKTASTSTPEKPLSYALEQNYPNPFNPTTIIKYQLPHAGHVTITLYDMLGRQVNKLVDEQNDAGYYQITFDASHLASGVYFYQLRSGSFLHTRKLLLVR